MSERPKEHASKACVGNTTVGSNPTATAKQLRRTRHRMVGNRVERCEASVCGYRMSYLRAGPVDGPVVVLLHGLASDSGTWTPAIPLLAEHGLRVFALDLLGNGDSDKPPISYELDELARQVEQFLTAVDVPRATVCGHSLGGAVAMQVAYRYPERVERMVLVSAGGLGRQVHVALRAAAVPGAQYLLGAALRPSLIRVYRRPGFHRALRLRPEAVVNLRRAGRALASVEGRSAFFAALNGVISPSGQRGSFIEMRNLATHVPVLLVWSERDAVIPLSHAQAAQAHLPASVLVVFPGGGHEPHRRNAVEFAQAVADFVASTP